MAIVLKLINDYDVWLYAAAAIVALFLLRAAILARRDRLQATFSLEREAARNREYAIMSVAGVVILVMAGVYAVERVLMPTITIPYEPTPTPTSIFVATLAPTEPPATLTPTSTATPRPTPRPTIALSTSTPTAQPRPVPGACPNPGANLIAPGNNAQLRGAVQIIGTAAIERFQFYKLEFGAGDNPGQWTFLLNGTAPVSGGLLGVWDTGPLSAGVYALRLVVVDQTGNFPEPCKVVVNIVK
jgi:hypothetical protein